MQYYKPAGDLNVGDCMPFFHDGLFRLFYLVDEGHHQALGGLGGHQWAQAWSADLVHWEHQPMAIAITEEREGSICTGSVLFHAGAYYAFYATRMRDFTQHLGLAVSEDGIYFRKTEPNPFASPLPGYSRYHYRDPYAFRDDAGRFHLLVSASLETYPVPERGGCLAHLVSDDLQQWEVLEPFLLPGLHNVPECADYFQWGDWYYLIFSNDGIARYRMSRKPFGPWLRPAQDVLDSPVSRVMKTAPFPGNRRVGVAWIGPRRDGQDNGHFQFGGNALFRELVQLPDGTLGTAFPPEMTPSGPQWQGAIIPWLGEGGTTLANEQGLAVARCDGVPRDARLTLRVMPQAGVGSFGLRLCAGETFETGYELVFTPAEGSVRLAGQRLTVVEGLENPFSLEIVLRGELVDVCIGGNRTLVDRLPQRQGRNVFFFVQNGAVEFAEWRVEEL